MATTEFIAAIELGSSRIAGIAGRTRSDGSLEVLAYAAEDASSFVRKGLVYNIDKAAHAIRGIVAALEGQLGETIAKVYAGIGGQSVRTVRNAVSRTLDEEGIISTDLVDELNDENLQLPLVDMCILDVAPQEYKIDNTLHADPVGVAGQRITGQFLNLVARHQLRKNLEQSFEKAEVKTADMPVAPLALAHAVLSPGEMRAGCALVDIGADTTTVQVYKDNILRYLSVLPLGGRTITHDLTLLKIEEEEAEQLKLHYGDAFYQADSNADTDKDADCAPTCLLADGRSIELPLLNDIIGARAEEILANAWNQIQQSGYERELLAGIILTGGGAALRGTDALFRKLSRLDKVRTAHAVQMPVHGCEDRLPADGRQNTLLGLLAEGTENCCQPPKAQPAPQPSQGTIFSNDPAAQAEKPKPAPEQNGSKTGGSTGTKTADKPAKPASNPRRPWYKTLFDNMKDGMLEDNSDTLSDNKK